MTFQPLRRVGTPIVILSDTDGEKDIEEVTTTEKRVILTTEAALERGILQDVVISVGTKVGTHPSAMNIYLIDTDAHDYTVLVTSNTDGNYIITINGTDYTFAASSNTVEQIRDGLLAAMAAETTCAFTASSTDTILLSAPTTGNTGYFAEITAPGGPDMTLTETSAHNQGNNTVHEEVGATLTGDSTVPDRVMNDKNLNKIVKFKGTTGKLQISLKLTTGGDATSDYDMTVQVALNAGI